MRILFVASEAAPLAQTGGLADVLGALPQALAARGHQVGLFLPAFSQVFSSGRAIEKTGVEFSVTIGAKRVRGSLLQTTLPAPANQPAVQVYLIEQDDYFRRSELYQAGGVDYVDNCERFVFFCRGVFEAMDQLALKPDILHAHDWQAGLVPAYLSIEHHQRDLTKTASVFTLHDLAFQGTFWHWDMLLTGLDWKYFDWRQMEFYGKLNLLKTGIAFADALTTVSPRYAQEIQTSPLGCGLEGVLQSRREVLTGIVHGIDDSWNPATDGALATSYDAKSAPAGKAKAKAVLQGELGLPTAPETPLVLLAGRFDDVKGIDLACEILRQWLPDRDVQFVALGSGLPKYQDALADLMRRNPRRLAARFSPDEALMRRGLAAADALLIPSRYEPCGTWQLRALRYGAVPIARATGGLADTVTGATEETLANGTATGFLFHDFNLLGLAETLERGLDMFRREKSKWARLQATGMCQDWSWNACAARYGAVYEQALARRGKR